MQWTGLKISGLQLITPDVFYDERGFVFEGYREPLYLERGVGPFVQDNVSFSWRGTIRALHFQAAPGQAKLISCVLGEIFDVAVDLREDSPTFMQWEGVVLDAPSHKQFYIPQGFAHGFCVLSETARVHYKMSTPYDPKTERSIRWNDPDFNIAWPIKNPILSPRDQTSPFFQEVRYALDHR